MTYTELKEALADTRLFTNAEIREIARTCGAYTLGNAVTACEVIGIELTGSDVDVIYGT